MKILTVVFAAALVLSGCTAGPKPESAGTGEKIRIFYNNDHFAYMEPCGCRVSPIGGMHRRWNAMKAYADDSRVLVDAGNFLFKTALAPEYLKAQWREQAYTVVEAYELLGAEAVAVGETEFALGVKEFQAIAAKAKFPFLSTNIYWKATGKPFLDGTKMIERYGKKIGIFAVFNPELTLPSELEARDPISHAAEAVSRLRSAGAEYVIALSHQGYDKDVALANKVKGISLIVGAHSQSLLQEPDMEGDTLLVQLSSQGQMVGMVEYEVQDFPKRRSDFLVAELNAEYDLGPKGVANPMKNLQAILNIKIEAANKNQEKEMWEAHQNVPKSFDTFISCRDCHSAQAGFQEKQLHAASFLTLVARKQEENLDCVRCHSVGLGDAGGFKSMSTAFLDERGNPIPWQQIKVGMKVPAEGTDYRKSPEKISGDVAQWIEHMKTKGVKKSFVSVQCENCHGPKAGHPFAMSTQVAKKVDSKLCLSCHTKEQMPAWYDASGKLKESALAAALKSVACPK